MPLFQVSLCESQEIVIVQGDTNLVNPPYFWSFSASTGLLVCGKVEFEVESGVPIYTAATKYNNCLECLEDTVPQIVIPPIYDVCVICSGSTFTVEPPHPVWTGLYGEVITQQNAATLGGVNGLNN